jgi:hypothetical protein
MLAETFIKLPIFRPGFLSCWKLRVHMCIVQNVKPYTKIPLTYLIGRIDCSQLTVNSIRVQMRHSCEMD